MASENVKNICQEEIQIDMTPMIDVTFQLLVFFMCTLQFAQNEGSLDCYLPKDIGVSSAPARKTPEEPVHIKLMKDEATKETVVWVGDSKMKGQTKYDSLFTTVDTIISKTPSSPVVIDPDINIPFQDIISTLNACRKVQQKPYGKSMEIKFSAKAMSDK